MGRQAYLDKIAFGRSAFEPTQISTQSSEYMQLESSQSEIPQSYQDATANNYTQLYDERGNPINPRSRDYGRKLRRAQNDVLASVGVVERRPSPNEGLPVATQDRFDLLEAEDTVGNAVALTTTLTENLCTWWIGSTRDRILTFRYPDALPFGQIIASEQALSGASMIYAGFASRLFSTISIQAVVYGAFLYQPIHRLLHVTRASARTRNFFRQTNKVLKSSLRVGLEVLFYPFFYHAALQRLGLISARPLLPSWSSLIPFSDSSPLLPFSLHYDASASIIDCLKAALTSPVILLCIEHSLERCIFACVYEAVESSIIRPNNADVQSRDTNSKDHALTVLGLRRQSPPLVRDTVNRALTMLGWAQPLTAQRTESKRTIDSAETLDPNEGQTIEVGSTQITNVAQLDLPISQTQDQSMAELLGADVIPIPIDAIDEMIQPSTPRTPMNPGSDDDDDDDDENDNDNNPRIRITSREGIVEMEVRLPPRVLSSHTELAEALGTSPNHRATASQNEAWSLENHSYHRVTQLSSEPAQMISAIVKAQIVGLVMLPIRMVTLRMVATHYLTTRGRHISSGRFVNPLDLSNTWAWHPIGIQLSRLALCGALELGVDLSLWGLQYLVVTGFGEGMFGWGTL
ncbi:hypothetical protein EJ02DRAFT_133062 [Clathrospora elynae]|uniref:Uncharacterized protein n=1 Tax=Clathrospora elynae TaxID=706981 RepID=A0A6A5SVT6_9PLEO|nr:hypothetical protein EJ02DRAFT_133062 [Clathrospora elynae]